LKKLNPSILKTESICNAIAKKRRGMKSGYEVKSVGRRRRRRRRSKIFTGVYGQ
jgi:hypothetical protein